MKKTVLCNGLTVITDHNEKAVSTLICYWVKAGGHYEAAYPHGIAHFLEHMMFQGTMTRTQERINELVEECGGRRGASTGNNRTKYFIYTPYDEWKQGVELLTDMVFHSTFPEQELAKEKKVVIEEIKRAEDNPREHGRRELMRMLSGMHPERANCLGTEASVSSITRDDLLRFHEQFYQPSNIVLVVTGHIDHAALVDYLESLTIPAAPEMSAPIVLDKLKLCPLDGRTIHIARDIRQSQLHWGMYGPYIDSEERYTGFVALHVLGGGSASRLGKQIRGDRGLAYDVSVRLSPGVSEGFITGYVATDPQRIDEARNIIIAELNRLKIERLQDDELTRAKKWITARYLVAEDYPEAINSRLASIHLFHGAVDPNDFVDKIRTVSVDDVLHFAETYLNADKMLFVQVSRDGDAFVADLKNDGRTA
ncbi:putative zinc protease [Paenibacillus solanacearum]|uniref:Zinc protease n=1 Tax=Paenibacillus solanacearum TaxID=2048548 RepID=A0A916NLH7_9BACL|nr:pitrilysin family protein [Paenibacillus solanacearum]CAG7648487.1 putative zinc protease [Paenibacillus solanacearum]